MKLSQRILAAAAAGTVMLTLGGCGSASETSKPNDPPQSSDTDKQPDKTQTTAPKGEPQQNAPQQPTGGENRLTLTVNGGEQDFAPKYVYCKGQPGAVHHLVAKGEQGLPLLEVTPNEFALLKVAQGRPFKQQAPGGITVSGDAMTFDHASIGGAIVQGTLRCAQFEH